MKPIFAQGNHKTIQNLISRRKEAIKDKAIRVASRIHAIILSIEKYTTTRIADILKVNRTTVPIWINNWNKFGEGGLLEGHRSGRKKKLTDEDLRRLGDIIESGPVAYGINSGVWTSVIIAEVIEDEFGVEYHPGHVRKILRKIGFSVQRPTTKLINGDLRKKAKWMRYTYPNLKKSAGRKCDNRLRG